MERQDLKIPVYTICDSNKFESLEDCFKEMDNLYHMIKNYIKRNNCDDASFIIGISNIDSKTAKINFVSNHKRGRPKKVITGKVIQWHIHLYVLCENSSVSKFSNELRIYLQKKKRKNFMQKKNTLDIAIPYIEKQCAYVRKCGIHFKK